jgi:hypothetical protein
MFEDPEETLILLMRMETEGTLGNILVSAFRKWYLFPPMSLLILNHYHCFTPYVQISHNHSYATWVLITYIQCSTTLLLITYIVIIFQLCLLLVIINLLQPRLLLLQVTIL